MQRYRLSQIILHWLVVLLVLGQYATSGSISRTHTPSLKAMAPSETDLLLHMLHNRLGLLIFCLLALRLALRFWQGVPAPLGQAGSLSVKIAGRLHMALYAMLGLQAVTGAIASYLWWPISIAHRCLFWAFLALVSLHVIAAFWHQFILKDGIFWRITGLKLLKSL